MLQLAQALIELEKCLLKYNKVNLDRLQPPLEHSILEDILAKNNCDDHNIRLLYQWRTGVPFDDHTTQVFGFGCAPLNIHLVFEYQKKFPISLPDHLLPIFAFGNDEVLLYNKSKGPDHGRIHLFSVSLLSIDPPLSYYDSLQSMLLTTIELYQKGGIVFDPNNDRLDLDSELIAKITIENNPNSSFYKR